VTVDDIWTACITKVQTTIAEDQPIQISTFHDLFW